MTANRSQTFLFADLAGFTALTEAMGDDEAVGLVDRFCEDVRALLPGHQAHEVKTMGDAIMLRAEEPASAIVLGVALVHDIGRRHEFPLVRVGMHTGPAIERAGDWFGATVNLAARVSALAGGGEVLLTDATRNAAGGVPGVRLHPRGKQALRNVEEPVTLWSADRSDQASVSLAIDPVCRMAVDPRHCAGHLTHNGVEHHFCSLDCAARFAAHPAAFA